MLLFPSSPRSWTSVTIASARGIGLVLPPFTAPFFGAVAGMAASLAAGLPVVVKAPWQAVASSLAASLVIRRTDLGDYVSASPFRGPPYLRGLSSVILFGRPETSGAVWRELGLRPSSNCSGRSAVLVCSEPSDVETLAKSIAELAVSHAGQACGSVRWVLTRRALAGPLVDSLADAVEQMSVGNPLEGKDIGPVRARGLVERAHRLVNDAVAKGASVEVEMRSSGNFASPGLLSGVPRGADLLWSDLQAPVLAVSELEDCSEAVETAGMMGGATHALLYGPMATAASLASSRPGLVVIRLGEEEASPAKGPCFTLGDPVEALSGGAELWGRSLLLF
ncbi:MAG: aldehyde dehydrogenase family protein, partial [Acidilobus sp.]